MKHLLIIIRGGIVNLYHYFRFLIGLFIISLFLVSCGGGGNPSSPSTLNIPNATLNIPANTQNIPANTEEESL